MNNTTFHNLPVFDLVCMLALLFMAFMLLRAEETKSTTMPVVTELVQEDSTNFSIVTYQIGELLNRLTPLRKRSRDESKNFADNKRALDAFLANPNFQQARHDTTLDIFMRLDTLIHTRKLTGDIIHALVTQRDTLLHHYLRISEINISTLDEDLLLFPVNQAVPFPIHRVTRRHIDDIVADICDTVDFYIEKKNYEVIQVIGHTDTTGTAKRNRVLSQQRAEYLAQKIRDHIERNYSTEKPYLVQPIGYGEFSPLPREESENIREWWQRCRRVDLVFRKLQRF